MWSRVQLDDIYRLRRVKKGTCLSAKKQPARVAFFLRESRDENPGFVIAQRFRCV